MGSNDNTSISDEQLNEFISALADEDNSGLSDEQVDFLQHVVRERPELLGEYKLNIATKLCLMKHGKNIHCPEATAESIRTILYHVYKSQQASL